MTKNKIITIIDKLVEENSKKKRLYLKIELIDALLNWTEKLKSTRGGIK